MFKKQTYLNLLLPLMLIIIIPSCSDYQKLLKSNDFNLKYEKAVEYYDEEDYYRAQTLFEEVLTIIKGTDKAEKAQYYYTYCMYNQGDYILAGYHFKNFSKTFPNSEHREETDYMSAYCYYMQSPNPSLDQTYTLKAIEEFQLFINRYPQSTRIEESNNYVDKLRDKLESKSFSNAKLYYNLCEYKAAIVSLKTSIKDFPDIDYREEIIFYILKSNFLLAENSINTKKKERYQSTVTEYYALIDEYPQSKYIKEAQKIYDISVKNLK